jgi:predicted nucleic acid-binding protein
VSQNYVLDASVVAKLLVDEDLSAQAHSLLRRVTMADADTFFSPEVMWLECANVLWKYVRRHGYSVEDAQAAVMDLAELAIAPVSLSGIVVETFELAVEAGLTVYDAAYAAVARGLDCTLVSADERLVRAVLDVGLKASHLAEMQAGGEA